jgi:hypothetical protein
MKETMKMENAKSKHNEALEKAGIQIFKVRAWIDFTNNRKRTNKTERELQYSEVFIGTDEAARSEFKKYKERLCSLSSMVGYSGKVELIIPEILDDGTVIHWGETLDVYVVPQE